MTHPLTEEIIDQIADDLSIFTAEDCMRAAADWQLEQVIEWLRKELITGDMVADSLKQAMRPQEES